MVLCSVTWSYFYSSITTPFIYARLRRGDDDDHVALNYYGFRVNVIFFVFLYAQIIPFVGKDVHSKYTAY